MRVAFAGTPEFAVPALRALVGAFGPPGIVLTQPDRPAGRGRRLTASPVKRAALEHGIRLAQPAQLDDPAALGGFGARPDVLVVAAYGLLLPQWLLDWPRVAPVNIHASLLPRWRGAAPIQRAVLAGDAETGVTLMRMVRALDAGPVYTARATPIEPAETAGQLHDRLAGLGAALVVDTLPGVVAGQLEPVAQDESAASYAPKIEKAEAALDWRAGARELERRVRAFNPWPVAETRFDDGGRLRIWSARVVPGAGAAAPPGTIVAAGPEGIDVAAGDGVLRLTSVQPPSGRRMDAQAYLAAHAVEGRRLG